MAADADSSIEEAPLFEFVPLSHYQLPDVPAQNAVSDAWTYFKRVTFLKDPSAENPLMQEAELRTLSEVRLSHLVPPLDYSHAIEPLKQAIAAIPQPAVTYLIGQPFCKHVELMTGLGKSQDARIIDPPTYDAILTNDQSWLDQWPDKGTPWVLPQLERWYLRDARGLKLIRTLMNRMESGHLGPGVVGCDSWAWAYLSRIWPVPHPDALTLQAFDARRLSTLFASIVKTETGRAVRFRNARSGNDILTVTDDPTAIDGEFVQLAAHCRGNVGTALEYWRRRLRSEPEDVDALVENEASENHHQDQPPPETQVWVADSLPDANFPATADEEEAAILMHTLLLHNGLPEPILCQLLPLSPNRARALLVRLRNNGLLELVGDRVYINELSYMVVRGILRSRKFQTDNF